MGVGDNISSVLDERGDTLEAILWGSVFLFTLLLFIWEFTLGAFAPEHEGLLPLEVITDFAQSMWLSALVGGGGVVVLITYAIFRYASGVRDRPAPLRPGQGSFKLAVFVIGVTAVVMMTIFMGASTLAQTDEADAGDAAQIHGVNQELEMSILAGQWFWRFDVEGIPFTQGERVVLPANTIVQFQTTSSDVIHSFSIKELGMTKDAVPGQINQGWFFVGEVTGETQLTFTTENGTSRTIPADTYEIRCAELCGKGHSKMIATIYIIPAEDYEAWAHAMGGEAAFSVPNAGIQIGNATAPGGDGHGDGHGDDGGHGGGH